MRRPFLWPMFALFVVAALLAAEAAACLWDYDTLRMERRRFPQALELVTGKFLRHSPEFYRWRIEDRLRRLETSPNSLDLYDDLAVAYDKTGQHEMAIEAMLKKEEQQGGLYETYANLGTFHIHAGRLEEGLRLIRQAIEVNPDAHFGREVYQQLLVEYVLQARQDDAVPQPLSTDERGYSAAGFAAFVAQRRNVSDRVAGPTAQMEKDFNDEMQRALKGVMGMMRFGHFGSPVLLEALGDLLLADSNQDGKRLAARAYLKASYEVDDQAARSSYRNLATIALRMQTIAPGSNAELKIEQLESLLLAELEEARRWTAAVWKDEKAWIAAGLNADEEFTKKYYEQPRQSSARQSNQWPQVVAVILVILAGCGALTWLVWVRFAARKLGKTAGQGCSLGEQDPSGGARRPL